jgi:O-antigen ligase
LTRRSWRRIDYTLVMLGSVVVLLSFSRGGVIALALALLLVAVSIAAPHFKGLAYKVAAVLFAALFVWAVLQFASVGPRASEDFNGGLGTRSQLWHGAYVLWRSSPLIGVGAGNYELDLASTGAPGVRTHANSVYFQTLAEEGLLGLIALGGLIIVSIRVFAYKGDSVLPTAMLAVVVALWFHQIIDYVTFYPKVGVLLWTMLGIGVAAGTKRDPG